MPLPGAVLFPHALLPLYIFEPRYRAMLEYALNHHRMFAVATLKPPRTQWNSSSDFFEIAGVGLIRACVGRNDGTSNLILQGLERVRFTGFESEDPYPLATVQALESDFHSSVETEALSAKVLELYSNSKETAASCRQKSTSTFPTWATRKCSQTWWLRRSSAMRPAGSEFSKSFRSIGVFACSSNICATKAEPRRPNGSSSPVHCASRTGCLF